MGLEAECDVRLGQQTSNGRARLEEKEILFRGDFRLKIPFGDVRSLRRAIKPDGAVWVVWPKGQKAFREDDARRAGPAAGLVDVKVASFSDALSALKMVIPVKERSRLR